MTRIEGELRGCVEVCKVQAADSSGCVFLLCTNGIPLARICFGFGVIRQYGLKETP